jgi:hypothetical protein
VFRPLALHPLPLERNREFSLAIKFPVARKHVANMREAQQVRVPLLHPVKRQELSAIHAVRDPVEAEQHLARWQLVTLTQGQRPGRL